MKFLTDRHEIGKAINIDNIPVLTIDIERCMKGYPDCYSGSKVRVLGGRSAGYSNLDTRCTVEMFGEEPGNECHDKPWLYSKIILSGSSVCIKRTFGLDDILNDVEWSNARTVKAGDLVLVLFKGADSACLRMMKVGDHVNPHCMTVATLVDVD